MLRVAEQMSLLSERCLYLQKLLEWYKTYLSVAGFLHCTAARKILSDTHANLKVSIKD